MKRNAEWKGMEAEGFKQWHEVYNIIFLWIPSAQSWTRKTEEDLDGIYI